MFGVTASYLGTDLDRHANPDALLLAFAALMLIAALAMLRRFRPPTATTTSPTVMSMLTPIKNGTRPISGLDGHDPR